MRPKQTIQEAHRLTKLEMSSMSTATSIAIPVNRQENAQWTSRLRLGACNNQEWVG
jgi:hypothetical protein